MTQDEIAVMDGGKCILQVRGVRPFFSDKFDITKHPKYKYLSDADPKNAFDMEKHIKRRPAIVSQTRNLTFTRSTGRACRRTQTVNKRPGTDKGRLTLLVNPKIREEQRRQAALRKFIKDCERLYEKNRAHLQEDANHE